jgi:hypothetical protein
MLMAAGFEAAGAPEAAGTVHHLPTSGRDAVPETLYLSEPLRPFGDPLVQTVITVVVAAVLGTAAWGFRSAGMEAIGWAALALSASSLAICGAVVGRALVRDRVIGQWRRERGMRQQLRIERARVTALKRVIERGLPADAVNLTEGDSRMVGALQELVAALEAGTDDIGGLIVRRTDDRYHVVQVEGQVGRRSAGIRPGKSCPGDDDLVDVLGRIAVGVAVVMVPAFGQERYLAVLAPEPFSEDDIRTIKLMLPAVGKDAELRLAAWPAPARRAAAMVE